MIRAGEHGRAGPGRDVDETHAETQAWDAWSLVQRVQAGDMAAFATLYSRYRPNVVRFVSGRMFDRHSAEDIVAETFTRALGRIGQFRWRGTDFGSWLITIAGNLIRDHFKSFRYRREVLSEDVGAVCRQGALADPRPGPAELAEAAMAVQALRAAMARLVPDQREVLVHRFLADRSLAETAKVMGRNTFAVRSLQHRATRALRVSAGVAR